jgi:type II secretory pathway pseudopilin PulG
LSYLSRSKILPANAGNREAGVSLIGTLVSVAILGLVVVFFMNGLSTLSRSDLILRQQAQAEGLARSQIESIKSQNYIRPENGNYTLISAPSGYIIAATVTPINPATGAALAAGVDNGVQTISVTVSYSGTSLLTLGGYKVDR